jgi:two-component system cell cycle sensor histidine kinase/response regulator CckA
LLVTFVFRDSSGENLMAPKSFPCTRERRTRPTILLVEDEPFVLDATCRILQNAGFLVLRAVDAQEAMQAYDGRAPEIDLVITDMVLPGRSGLQLAQDLRRDSPSLAILMTSGYAEAGCDTDSLDAHTYYLAKPYCRGTLIEKIAQILGTVPFQRAAGQNG